MKNALIRDRLVMTVCALAATGILVAMASNFGPQSKPTVESVSGPSVFGSVDVLNLQFLGDTMIGDGAVPLVAAQGYDAPLNGVRPLLDGDFVIANAEAPIGLQTVPANPGKAYSYNSDPEAAAALRRAGVDALGLGNNHSMDMGLPGLQDTIKFASANDLLTFGAGADLTEAERPLLVRSTLGTVGIVALGENFGQASKASAGNSGTVVLSPATVQRGIDLARTAGADWVIAYVHWGDNYQDTNAQQRYWAKMLVAAGYDLVVGTGPHTSGPIEFIGSVPVAYSIGNFVFGAPGRFASFGKSGIGLSLNVKLSRSAPTSISVRCILADNFVVDFVPQACPDAVTRAVMPRVNPRLYVYDNAGHMDCDCLRPVRKDE
ncbi:MAG: CapA family protein [Cryobacterium sp.]